jgi:hypothetical protein
MLRLVESSSSASHNDLFPDSPDGRAVCGRFVIHRRFSDLHFVDVANSAVCRLYKGMVSFTWFFLYDFHTISL